MASGKPDILNDALDLELTRRTPGSFSIDLVAENNDGQIVIIENQLEKIIMTSRQVNYLFNG